jgi:hypothetical protein
MSANSISQNSKMMASQNWRPATRRALVIDCSFGKKNHYYNLGAAKLALWLQTEEGGNYWVDRTYGEPDLIQKLSRYDLVCLSVIFSWDAPLARNLALHFRDSAEIWAGGPGLFALGKWWREATGLDLERGLDPRFDKQRGGGTYKMTLASRGCPVGCSWCIVPKLEGNNFTFDYDFEPAHILADNNLSALPLEFQQHIIQRYQETNTRLLDCNSGFEPHSFDVVAYQRWRQILVGPWRFAFDEERERDAVEQVMLKVLHQESPSKKQVYVLNGNEPLENCYDRALSVIAWGGEVFTQAMLPLNWLGDPTYIRPRYDWADYQQGKDFSRYFNRHLWRYFPITDYKPRTSGTPPFIGSSVDTPSWRRRWENALVSHQNFKEQVVKRSSKKKQIVTPGPLEAKLTLLATFTQSQLGMEIETA